MSSRRRVLAAVRGDVPDEFLGVAAIRMLFEEADRRVLEPILEEWCSSFGVPPERVLTREFTKVAPSSSRPFATYYNPRSV